MKNESLMKSNANGVTSCCAYDIFSYMSIRDNVERRDDTYFEELARRHLADGHIPRMVAKVPGQDVCSESSAFPLAIYYIQGHTPLTQKV